MSNQSRGSGIQISGGNPDSYINSNSSENQKINYGKKNVYQCPKQHPMHQQHPPQQHEPQL